MRASSRASIASGPAMARGPDARGRGRGGAMSRELWEVGGLGLVLVVALAYALSALAALYATGRLLRWWR